MAAEYAPKSIRAVFDAVKAGDFPTAEFAGIVGDANHTYGYHRARSRVSPGDYSIRLARDLSGDPDAACALDITLRQPADMIRGCSRLEAAAHARDGRLAGLREWIGTLNGTTVVRCDLGAGCSHSSSDSSHLWHIHLSFYRDTATLADRVIGVADVLNAGTSPAPQPSEDDMPALPPCVFIDKAAGNQNCFQVNPAGELTQRYKDRKSGRWSAKAVLSKGWAKSAGLAHAVDDNGVDQVWGEDAAGNPLQAYWNGRAWVTQGMP